MTIAVVDLDSEGVAGVFSAGNEGWHTAQITSRFIHPWFSLWSGCQPLLAGESGDPGGCRRTGAFQALARKADASKFGGVSTVSWGMPGSVLG